MAQCKDVTGRPPIDIRRFWLRNLAHDCSSGHVSACSDCSDLILHRRLIADV